MRPWIPNLSQSAGLQTQEAALHWLSEKNIAAPRRVAFVDVYVCVFVFIYDHVCVFASMYLYCTYVHDCTCMIYDHVCVFASMYLCSVHVHIYIYMCRFLKVCLFLCLCVSSGCSACLSAASGPQMKSLFLEGHFMLLSLNDSTPLWAGQGDQKIRAVS